VTAGAGTPPEEAGPKVLRFTARPAASRLAVLDRDGVLIVDHGHVFTRQQVEWIPGAPRAVRMLRDAGYAVVIATNQAGIAKGLYGEDQFVDFTRWFVAELAARGGAIDAVYYCPHHPTEGRAPYGVDCPCRKPKPGMLLRALDDAGAAAGRSLMVGDKQTDLQAARAAGMPGHLFTGGDLGEFVTRLLAPPAG
jgi:D-glycero-D-manno-heptose 1,7-bisphosphate phosphatase